MESIGAEAAISILTILDFVFDCLATKAHTSINKILIIGPLIRIRAQSIRIDFGVVGIYHELEKKRLGQSRVQS